MIFHEGDQYYTITDVAKAVGRCAGTVNHWLAYAETRRAEGEDVGLPEPIRLTKKGIRCWTIDEVSKFIEFRDQLKRGDLADYNRSKVWGERGKEIEMRKRVNDIENM